MKKFILRFLAFFFIVSIIDFCYGLVFDYINAHANGGGTKRMRSICLEDKHDILIMGSSRAQFHYVPQIFEDSLGKECYNAGYSGNGILLNYGIYKMLTKRYKPQLIIYDVEPAFDIYEYAGDNNHTRYLSEQKPYFRDSTVAQIFKDVSISEYYKVHLGLCRYNTVFISKLIDFFANNSLDEQKGYCPLMGEIKKEPENKTGKTKLAILDSLKLTYMHKLIKDASEKNIPLLIIFSPCYGEKDSKRFDIIKGYCKENDVPYLDFYADKEFMSHKEYFKEPMHLNNNGAHVFTKYLMKYIREYLE